MSSCAIRNSEREPHVETSLPFENLLSGLELPLSFYDPRPMVRSSRAPTTRSPRAAKTKLPSSPSITGTVVIAEDLNEESPDAEDIQAFTSVEPEVLEDSTLEWEAEVLEEEDNPVKTIDASYPIPAPRRDLVRYDPLDAYLREISQFKPMSREEEKDIAVTYYENKDVQAAYKLISSNLWLVVKIARQYERAARNLLDLVQEGNIGLMEAVKNFDPYREVRFPSYAAWWVKAYIIRYVIANWRLVKLGTTQAQRKLFFNLKKEKDRLEREGFSPEPKLIAQNLQVKESDVIEMEQRLGHYDLSMDAPSSSDSEQPVSGLLAAPGPNAEQALTTKQEQQLLHSSLGKFEESLNDREKAIYQGRILADEKVTLHDLSEQYHLSKERVRQIENRIRDKLKTFLVAEMGDALEGYVESE